MAIFIAIRLEIRDRNVIAGALYRRAIAILETVGLRERKQPLLAKILEDQATMLRMTLSSHASPGNIAKSRFPE